ncbi:MAG: HAMP domain-containing histidine kinase [Clostridia bacterium]|nr:HAMP domain-containing histidine kinase [Clostridia bacterium]
MMKKRIRSRIQKIKGKKYSLRTQFFGVTAFFICAGTFAILLANTQLIPLIYTLRQTKNLTIAAEQVGMALYESKDFYADMTVIEDNYNVEVELYNSDGRLVYISAVNDFLQDWVEDSGINLFDVMRTRNLTLIERKVLNNGTYFETLKDDSNGLQYLMFGTPIGTAGTLKVYAQMDYLSATANATTRYVSIVACGTFMFIIISVYFYLHHFSKPLIEMNKITRDMAKMDFSQKCPPYANNEIGELGQSINTLSASLDATLKDLQQKNKQLEADIEHKIKVEQARKEFVSNSSHELKTPIAIIQGYAEGLKLGMKSGKMNTDDYCDIIIEETHKMNRLVCDMLELSKYETGSYTLEERSFDIGEFVRTSIESYDILAKESGIEIINNIPNGLTGYGDPQRLEMVIHNYVSNALSHAKYDKKIILSAAEAEGSISVSVFNTGDHIAENDLENIWQSFYRADKAHSRDEGRFGLGLSIVKAIQELHGMPYSAQNVEGGVTFSFDIKKPDGESEK